MAGLAKANTVYHRRNFTEKCLRAIPAQLIAEVREARAAAAVNLALEGVLMMRRSGAAPNGQRWLPRHVQHTNSRLEICLRSCGVLRESRRYPKDNRVKRHHRLDIHSAIAHLVRAR